MKTLLLILLALITGQNLFSQNLEMKVVDVGAGLCVIVKFPNQKYMIYDAGSDHSSKGKAAIQAISEVIPKDSEIELLIISHTDADHIYAVDDVLKQYKVKEMYLTGYDKETAYREIENKNISNTETYKQMISAIDEEVANEGMIVTNLFRENRNITVPVHRTIEDVDITILCGFGRPLAEWTLHSASHAINAVSIVAKLEFKGKSILICGDAVGRIIKDPVESILATEKFLIEKVDPALLDVDVIVAPHHGADNGSSKEFVEATTPTYVIFSSGTPHGHPTKQAVERYVIYAQLDEKNIFRTDRGEGWVTNWSEYNSSKVVEWNGQARKKCEDTLRDDDVLVEVFSNGFLRVKYMQSDPCD